MCRRRLSTLLAFQLVSLHLGHFLRAENPVAPNFFPSRRKIGPDHFFLLRAGIGHKPREGFPVPRDLDRLPVVNPSGNSTEIVPEIGNSRGGHDKIIYHSSGAVNPKVPGEHRFRHLARDNASEVVVRPHGECLILCAACPFSRTPCACLIEAPTPPREGGRPESHLQNHSTQPADPETPDKPDPDPASIKPGGSPLPPN